PEYGRYWPVTGDERRDGPVRERGQNEGPGRGGTWAARLRQGRTVARVRSGRGLVVGEFEVALGQFLDVDVLERDDADVLDEAGRAVHVPDPGVLHDDLEKDLAIVRVAHVELNLVGEVEAPLGLHYMAEEAHDVAILAIQLQLHLGFVLFEILCAHGNPSDPAGEGARPAA